MGIGDWGLGIGDWVNSFKLCIIINILVFIYRKQLSILYILFLSKYNINSFILGD